VWEKIAAAIDDRPVIRIVDVLKIVPEQKIADVGSGEGRFIFPLAEWTGKTAVVYAVGINTEALRKVETLAQTRGEGQCLACQF
jgi:ubiquinone/menaquinone biosynthesis C-methylase UbiE